MSEQERFDLWAALMQEWSAPETRQKVGVTKQVLRQAIDAVNDWLNSQSVTPPTGNWIDANEAGWSAQMDGGLTTAQQRRIVDLVIERREG